MIFQIPLICTRQYNKMLQLIYLTYSLTDNSPWKLKFFVFVIFIFSTLHHFSEKIYEKTCFYNMFSKFSSICARLPSFTIWIFFSKKWWLFQLNIHISMFEQLLQENLWKDIPYFSHIYIQITCHILYFHKVLVSENFY